MNSEKKMIVAIVSAFLFAIAVALVLLLSYGCSEAPTVMRGHPFNPQVIDHARLIEHRAHVSGKRSRKVIQLRRITRFE